jgi:hypothetical protein
MTRYETLRLWVWTFQHISTKGQRCPGVNPVSVTSKWWTLRWIGRSSGNGMQRLEVTRQRALRPGPRNLRWKHVKNWLEIGLQIGVNDLQFEHIRTVTRRFSEIIEQVHSMCAPTGLIRDCLLRVRLSWMNDSDGTDFEALCVQSFMESGLVRSESHWTSKFRWILRWSYRSPEVHVSHCWSQLLPRAQIGQLRWCGP